MNARAAAPPVPDYVGRRVLVLGATGFIGRWTAVALARAGADVHVAARDPPHAESLLRGLGTTVRAWPVDLARPGVVAPLIAAVAPSQVFNLACHGVRPTERDERLAERLNVELVEELGQALASRRPPPGGGPVLVHTGSAAEYGNVGGDLSETGPALPGSLYGRTKLAGTRAIERLADERGLNAVVARPFTVYGPGEPPGRLLPTLFEAARTGRPADLTDGRQKRDFTYVEDVAEGLVRLGRSEAPGGYIANLATGVLLAAREFVAEAAAVLGIPRASLRFGAIQNTREEMEHEPVNTTRMTGLLGWRPTTSVADGVRRTRERSAGTESAR